MKAAWKIIILTLTALILINPASAANACCEKTTDGQWCAYVDQSQCDTSFKSTFASCEQTSYCTPGCCYSSDTGQCFKNAAKSTCAQVPGALWNPSKECGIDQCKMGCCLIGDQAIFTTEVKCKKTASQFEELTFKFDNTIQTEAQCISAAKNQDEGCCVKADSCSFTTRGSCQTTTEISANATKGTGFYKDMLCSNDQLSCDCAKQSTTKCFGEDLFWVDSCGNKENIYSSDKEASFNKGYTLKESQSCTLTGPGDTSCGNCDYPKGTVCGKDAAKEMPIGTETCVSLGCAKTYKDDAGASVNADGSKKKNGESWCVYDSLPGQGLDAVGSRHYRFMCINGEEQVDPCKDFREEICMQGVLDDAGKQKASSTYDAFFAKGDYIEAACRANLFQSCASCNNPDWSQDKKQSCCGNDGKDCYWAGGYCTPQVPPGLKFWGDTKGSTTTDAPKGSAEAACAQMQPAECKVLYHRGGARRIGAGIGIASEGWEVVANKNCTTKDWILTTNDLCKSMGDCGAYFNVLGKPTLDGYSNTLWDESKFMPEDQVKKTKLTEADLGSWHKLMGPPSGSPEGPSTWKQIFNWKSVKDDMALVILIVSGAKAAVAAGSSAWFSGFTSGLYGGPAAYFTKEATVVGIYGAAGTVSSEAVANAAADAAIDAAAKEAVKAAGKEAGQFVTDEAVKEAARKAATDAAKEVASQGAEAMTKAAAEAAAQTATEAAGATGASGTVMTAAAQEAVKKAATDAAQKTATESIAGASSASSAMAAVNTIMWIYMAYKVVDIALAETKDVTYKAECLPWQAPSGGEDCEKCNEPMKPCSEYKCKSLGQSCQLINKGLGNETCVAINTNDVTSPVISPVLSVLPKDLQTEVKVTADPSNPGYEITKKLKAFTPVTVGISTNEPAQCKLDAEPKKKFDEMTQYFGSAVYLYNHTTRFTLPSELTQKEVVVKNDGEYAIYVRCQDANGNKNEKDYFIKFSVDPTPDLTPPQVQYTSIVNNGYVANNVTETPFSAYINEPAECKWSKMDIAYELMENTMQCAQDAFGQSSVFYGTYECKTTLSGLGLEPTNYFIRCKDQPGAAEDTRNKNTESFKFTVRGSRPLHMLGLEPSGTQYANNVALKTTTAVGAEAGKASCAFSQQDAAFENMILFAKTDDIFHEQPFEGLATGDYTFHVKCRDAAGNEASNSTTFTVAVDTSAPRIQELYVDGVVLHLTFDEKSTCEYSDKAGKAFGEGTMMTNANTTTHEASLNINSYYIKCKDLFGNEGSYEIHL